LTDLALAGAKPTVESSRHRPWPAIGEAERSAVLRVLDRGILSGSHAPEATALEDEFAAWIGAEYCLLTHSGTSALHLALSAAGVKAGDHVIIPAYSFVATAHAVVHAGAIPIFVDVDPETGLIDLNEVASSVTPRTRAIMPVHVHGCPADLGPLMELASAKDLLVIEDAAQAHGARYRGRPSERSDMPAAFRFSRART
jgi:dTDP-4-amino-4,6-dideoxygalactose transaminase